MPNESSDRSHEAAMTSYRENLEKRYAETAASYDNTLVALSGGALAVSFAFLKDIVPEPSTESVEWLVAAWFFLGASLAATLVSLFSGQHAIRRAMKQVDDETIDDERPGGKLSLVTHILNAVAGACFLVGVGLLAHFAQLNLGS